MPQKRQATWLECPEVTRPCFVFVSVLENNMDIQLTISIVNWNVKDYLEKCLESIFKYSTGVDFEVFVVDNASKDNSADMVKEKFPQVTLIENKENIGYGSAHNQVIPQARGKYILFLNPDTELLPDTLSRMIKFMDTHPGAGVCKCRTLRNRNDTSELIVLTKFKRKLFLWSKNIHSILPNPITAYLCGYIITKAIILSRIKDIATEMTEIESGSLLVKMDALRQTGGFAPNFFHSGEGGDLTSRIRKNGWKLYRIATVKIVHYGNKSADRMTYEEWIGVKTKWERYVSNLNA